MKSLTRTELANLLDAAGSDKLLFAVMFNHGLRVARSSVSTTRTSLTGISLCSG